VNQKVRNRIHEFEYRNIKEQKRIAENNTLESWGSLESADPLSQKISTKGCWRKFGENKGSVKIFTVWTPLFIGARGAVSRTLLDLTVANFLEDSCPLRHSEGDVFTKIRKFSWKRIIGVNLLPRRASVGEFGKTLAPSKRRVVEILETGSNIGRKV
jgi:hypothetical protein